MKNPIRFHLLLLFLPLLFILFIYGHTLDAPFAYDDRLFITLNPLIENPAAFEQKLQLSPLQHKQYDTFYRRYLTTLTIILNYKIHGFSVTGFHILNIAIHIISSWLVYWLVLLALSTPFLRSSTLQPHAPLLAIAVSLLFAVHPIQTQAITYIWQRCTSLGALFYLASMATYLKSRLSLTRPHALVWYALAFLCSCAGMLSKESVFTLPFAIALMDFMFFPDKLKLRLIRLFPLSLTLAIIPLIYVALGSASNMIAETSGDTIISQNVYLMTQFRVIMTYLRLLILPVRQNIDYHYPITVTPLDPEMLASLAAIIAIIVLSAYLYRASRTSEPALRLASFGILFFFLALAVESSFVPIRDVIYEHRLYLPSAGIFLTAVILTAYALKQIPPNKFVGLFFLSAFLCMVLALSVATYNRNRVWNSSIALWKDAVAKSPEKQRVYINLALAWISEENNVEKAQRVCLDYLSVRPGDVLCLKNIGRELNSLDRHEEAQDIFRQALLINSNSPDILQSLGESYFQSGKYGEAERTFLEALSIQGERIDFLRELAEVYALTAQPDKAIPLYRKALALSPDTEPEILLQLASALRATGNIQEAAQVIQTLLQQYPDNAQAKALLYSLNIR